MKIALIGASGRAGSRILQEAVSRGHEVTAITRNPAKVAEGKSVTSKQGDVFDGDGLAELLKAHDAVVSSVHFLASDARKLIGAVRDSGVKRYVVVGGAGSLEVEPGVRLIDTPEFPEAYKGEALAGADFLTTLSKVEDLDWTFISPSAVIDFGERTGKFRLGKDQLLTNEKGSSISFEDFAVALVDELETPQHVRERFTVGY